MIFRPKLPCRLWDTWLFPWKGEFHLFYLETTGDQVWDRGGHVVSRDMLHWEERPHVKTRGLAGTWNDSPTFTGMTVEHEGRFYLFAGANPGGVEVVGIYVSDDLDHWREYDGNPVMRPQAPHYRVAPTPGVSNQEVDFRDPCVFRDPVDGMFHAVLCARAGEPGVEGTGAAFAHYRSPDLFRWEAMLPLAVVGDRFYHAEVPDVFCMNGTHYIIFSTMSFPLRIDTPSREAATGSFYLMGGRDFREPYRLPADPLLVGSGGYAGYRLGAYVLRTIPWKDGRLAYHIVNANPPVWGMPKMVCQQADGTLGLGYLPLMEGLETRTVVGSAGDVRLDGAVANFGAWRRDRNGLTGRAGAGAARLTVARGVPDCHISVRITGGTAERAGVCFKIDDREMALLYLDYTRNELYVGAGKLNAPWGLELFPAQDRARRPLKRDVSCNLRVFVRDQHVEAYLDDRWVFTYVLGGDAKADGVGLLVHRGESRFDELRVAAIESLS